MSHGLSPDTSWALRGYPFDRPTTPSARMLKVVHGGDAIDLGPDVQPADAAAATGLPASPLVLCVGSWRADHRHARWRRCGPRVNLYGWQHDAMKDSFAMLQCAEGAADMTGTEVWSAAFARSHKARLDALATKLATTRSAVVRLAIETLLLRFERLVDPEGDLQGGASKS